MDEDQNYQESQENPTADLEARLNDQDAKIDKIVDSMDEQGKAFLNALRGLSEKIDSVGGMVVEQQQAPQGPPSAPPAELLSLVDENIVRFASPIKSYGIVREHGHQVIQDGVFKSIAQKVVQFENGIFDVDVSSEEGQQVAEFLRTHKDYGVDFIEDPTARPLPGPVVTDGPRSSAQAAQRPAELAART